MPTRSEIQDTLAASQEKVFAYFAGLSRADLERPCTASGVPGEAPWSAKDHFAHLTANEEGIQTLLRLSLTGGSLPENLATMSQEERIAWSNQRNQTYVNEHRNDSMETLRANLSAVRQGTLDLLAQFTDEQLAAPISLSFIPAMPASNLFAANAQHADAHIAWVEEGLRKGL
ncbi:MAG TPA: DinB family protein [Ktedonobacteraceae bacterium]|nr:DinB family protein [Ktedonobacteraceae bacterium]